MCKSDMQSEKTKGEKSCVTALSDGKEVQVKKGLEAQIYKCTNCFGIEVDQESFFHQCGITNLLESTVEGYRSCAFAFGQVSIDLIRYN